MFFIAIFLDMLGLRKVPISYIPIIESSSYVFIIIFSRIFLGEKINRRKTVAILTILAGIGIYLL
ncbi:EamA family transporter [uncultured Treponema sp.]|uniref:EamA family transporter n=1 Tax=uncultured Treponema sp. TaxID=162155 RepID=UPI00338E5D99